MLVVETIAKIRRAYFQDRKPIKQICRELRVSRKTVRKVVRSGATEFSYERRVQPQPKIGPWRDELDRMLAENARRAKRERLTRIRIYEELRALGYDGGYDAVRRYAASWSKAETAASAAAYVPLSFDPGEAYQFDWSHEIVLIDGVTTTVKVAHVRLCHSRMVFVRAYPRETQEMVFDAHDKAFAFFGGACARGRNGAPFKAWELPPAMRRIQRKLGRVPNGDRQMVELLGAVLTDGLDAVEAACAEAVAEGVHAADVVLNILARRREPAPPLTIATPDALRLSCEPVADCARYDSLRRPNHGKIAGAGRDGPAQALRDESGL